MLEQSEGKYINFSVKGRTYEIDPSESNAKELHDAFAPFDDVACLTGSAIAGRTARAGSRTKTSLDLGAVREQARASGHTVSNRCCVPATMVDAYQAGSAQNAHARHRSPYAGTVVS